MVSEIEINGQKFRARPANEFNHLATLILPLGSAEVFEDNVCWPLFLKQNRIEGGKHGTPRVVSLINGTRRLSVGVTDVLAENIRNLGGKGALGGFTVTAHVSK